jgi:hypothetical protein
LEKQEVTPEDRIVIAMKNAEAIAQTLCHHGEILEEFDKRILYLANLIQTLAAEVQNLKTLYHKSLVHKYGTGPTEPTGPTGVTDEDD